jgi:ataxia telangiectasia mutated family protein
MAGAHSRYYPGEWDHAQCRTHFKNAPVNLKHSAFVECCSRFSLAFRFFFVERFGNMKAWHAAKMLFSRSSTVSSIVGHVLGIGDRHSHNILIHTLTGEVVHIDFGIVFEQGKCLATPETVPFRLTRDIVDGMGCCGTEGVFSIAATKTMKLLRENSENLLTILEVCVHDPLYKWMVNPLQARQKQDEGDNEVAVKVEKKRGVVP